jgi:hypothetical protein
MIRKVLAWLVLCVGIVLFPPIIGFALNWSISVSNEFDFIMGLGVFLACPIVWIILIIGIADSISPFRNKPRDQSGQISNHDDFSRDHSNEQENIDNLKPPLNM